MPDRIQISRRKGWRMPPGTIKADRNTIFGNPWVPGNQGKVWIPGDGNARWFSSYWLPGPLTALDAVTAYATWLRDGTTLLPDMTTISGNSFCADMLATRRDRILNQLMRLRGYHFACWCPASSPCHADVLLRIANE